MLILVASLAGCAAPPSAGPSDTPTASEQADAPVRQLIIEGSEFELTGADLEARADAKVVVNITSAEAPRWNSKANEEWTSADPFERTPMIYRDFNVEVVRAVSGSVDGDHLSIRTIGGRVGDVEFVMESDADLEEGRIYLLYLKRATLPTKEGSEEAWMVVGGAQGAFHSGPNSKWENPYGLTATE